MNKGNSNMNWDKWYDPTSKIHYELSKHLLLTTKQILDEQNIPFLLVFGTLLGAYRDKSFIAHDTDVDVALFYEDIQKVKSLIDSGEFMNQGIELIRDSAPYIYSLRYEEDYIDLYFFQKTKKQYRCGQYKLQNEQVAKPFATIEFLGTSFSTVHTIEDYLTSRYGDWKIVRMNKHAKH